MTELAVGDRVRWTSTLTGRPHTGHIVESDNGRGMVLVRPDQPGYDWTAWEPAVNIEHGLYLPGAAVDCGW